MAPVFEKVADVPYEAFVLWWDSGTLAVYCPLCAEVECHDTQSEHGKFNWDEVVTLTALCRSTGVTYEAVFPWKVGLGWEKNWECKRLDTIGLDLSKIGIRESWQPTSMTISGPPLRARKDPLFWAARVTSDRIRDSLPYLDGQQNGNSEANERHRENRRSTGPALRLEIPVPPLSSRTILGDMRLMESERPKSNWIKILAPAATLDGTSMPDPWALISSHKLLKHKTVAVLDRKGPYTPIIAVSGWKDSLSGADNVINQEFWSQEVHELVQYISHKLKGHNLDRGIKGRVSASHAEKQLMAYFVRMHCFLEDGFEEDKMERLKMLPSHAWLREAWIAIDHSPCKDCKLFRKEIQAVCHVKFHFVRMQDNFRSKKDQRTEETRTPPRSSIAKFPLLTPPDSGSLLSESESHNVEEEEEDGDDDLDDYCGDGDSQSPCHERNLRSVAARLPPQLTKDNSYLSETGSAFHQKRPRSEMSDESYRESYDELGSSPPPSPARRIPSGAKRSRRPPGPSRNSPRAYPMSSHVNSRAPIPQTLSQEQHHRYAKLSAADIMGVINEVSDEIGEQEQEEDDSTDSDTPIIAHSRRNKRSPREKIFIDLTGDTTEDDEESEGSCFSP